MFKTRFIFQKWNTELKKYFLIFQIVAFKLGVIDSHNLEHNTCHLQSMCQHSHLWFHLTLGETFSKSTSVKILKKNVKSTLIEIWQVFWTLSHVHYQYVFWNDLESGPTKIFTVFNFGNTLTITIILFWKMFKICCTFQKRTKNREKVFRISDNCIWIGSCKFSQSWSGYLPSAIGSQSVNKHA